MPGNGWIYVIGTRYYEREFSSGFLLPIAPVIDILSLTTSTSRLQTLTPLLKVEYTNWMEL